MKGQDMMRENECALVLRGFKGVQRAGRVPFRDPRRFFSQTYRSSIRKSKERNDDGANGGPTFKRCFLISDMSRL
ncbi:uncharacterized [Tachysurus ichikawai]